MTEKTQPDMATQAVLDGVRRSFAELTALQAQQRKTTALMLKLCIMRIESPDSRKRREGIAGLNGLLELLETGK